MADSGCIGIFGGTFDPIHYGHLRTALEMRLKLGLREIRFIPCNLPNTAKLPLLGAADRLAMVEAAIASEAPHFTVDPREVRAGGRSYTVRTLMALRAEDSQSPLGFIVGMDAFASLPQWQEWERLFELAHLLVAHRPGWRMPEEGSLARLLEERMAPSAAAIHDQPGGFIRVEQVTQLEISSTDLRQSIAAGVDPKFLVPPSVRTLILETECYATKKDAFTG